MKAHRPVFVPAEDEFIRAQRKAAESSINHIVSKMKRGSPWYDNSIPMKTREPEVKVTRPRASYHWRAL